jgi:hypothetical protein
MLLTVDTPKLVHSPEKVSAYVDTLIRRMVEEGQYYDGPNRRSEPRYAVALQVWAMPLTSDLQSAGRPFVGTTKDISRSGISLVHYEPVDCPLLAIELTDLDGNKFQGAIEVLRCRQLGSFYEVAGKYVTQPYEPGVRNGL